MMQKSTRMLEHSSAYVSFLNTLNKYQRGNNYAFKAPTKETTYSYHHQRSMGAYQGCD